MFVEIQECSDTPSNQEFITIVDSSGIFSIFDVNFFILENVIPQMPLSVTYQTRASFFWTTVRDLCSSEPGYLMPKRDDSCVP